MLGGKIKELRKNNNLTLKQLAVQAHISLSYLSDIERGRSNPSLETLSNIAHALKVSPSYFMGDEAPKVAEQPVSLNLVKIPLLNDVSYDQALFNDENVLDYIWINLNYLSDENNLFFFKVRDNTMFSNRLRKGDLVLVSLGAEIASGDLVLAVFKKTGAFIRKAYRLDNSIILEANHPHIKPVYLDKNTPARIVGKVILALVHFD